MCLEWKLKLFQLQCGIFSDIINFHLSVLIGYTILKLVHQHKLNELDRLISPTVQETQPTRYLAVMHHVSCFFPFTHYTKWHQCKTKSSL